MSTFKVYPFLYDSNENFLKEEKTYLYSFYKIILIFELLVLFVGSAISLVMNEGVELTVMIGVIIAIIKR